MIALVLVVVFAVPVAYWLGQRNMKQILTDQARRDAASVARQASLQRLTPEQATRNERPPCDIAERTRILAARNSGHWGGSEETGAW